MLKKYILLILVIVVSTVSISGCLSDDSASDDENSIVWEEEVKEANPEPETYGNDDVLPLPREDEVEVDFVSKSDIEFIGTRFVEGAIVEQPYIRHYSDLGYCIDYAHSFFTLTKKENCEIFRGPEDAVFVIIKADVNGTINDAEDKLRAEYNVQESYQETIQGQSGIRYSLAIDPGSFSVAEIVQHGDVVYTYICSYPDAYFDGVSPQMGKMISEMKFECYYQK